MTITLKYGQTGEDIKRLQVALIKTGHLSPRAPDGQPNDDGIFGLITERAVRAFQQANGLDEDGVVGADTRKKLGFAEEPVPDAAPSAKTLFTDAQRRRIAEKLDAFIPTGQFDLIDGPMFMWIVKSLEFAIAAHLPQRFVDIMNDLNLSSGVSKDEFTQRLADALSGKINIPLIPEKIEQKMIWFLVETLVQAMRVGENLDGVLKIK